jgi:hypothetical protein
MFNYKKFYCLAVIAFERGCATNFTIYLIAKHIIPFRLRHFPLKRERITNKLSTQFVHFY